MQRETRTADEEPVRVQNLSEAEFALIEQGTKDFAEAGNAFVRASRTRGTSRRTFRHLERSFRTVETKLNRLSSRLKARATKRTRVPAPQQQKARPARMRAPRQRVVRSSSASTSSSGESGSSSSGSDDDPEPPERSGICEFNECEEETHSHSRFCSGHAKQKQLGKKLTPLKPKLTLAGRILELAIAVLEAPAEDQAEYDKRLDTYKHGVVEWADHLRCRRAGKARMAALAPEERSALGRAAALARWGNSNTLASRRRARSRS